MAAGYAAYDRSMPSTQRSASDYDEFVRLEPRAVPLGGPRGMTVHRTLPARETSLVGAWCFVDHFGPDDVAATGGMRVARHPHTGLATVSWLFQGAITHRDSIGSHALVTPGDVDLMSAGRGITHSEHSTLDATVLHGVQLWFALPDAVRHGEREFVLHRPEEQALALADGGSARMRVGLGALEMSAPGAGRIRDASPVRTPTELLLAQLELDAGGIIELELNPAHEHAVLVDRGPVALTAAGPAQEAAGGGADGRGADGRRIEGRERELVLVPDGSSRLALRAGEDPGRILLIGGEPLGEEILMWWNFVGRTHEEILAFRARYQAEIGAEHVGEPLPPLEPGVRTAGLAESDEQFGPFPADTPAALPAPRLPNGRLRSRGRTGMRR